ncbi:MFS transporter, partial [Cupriavidus sp. CP313]
CFVLVINTVVCLPAIVSGGLCPAIQGAAPPLFLAPLVLVAMNIVYSLSAYPFGKLADAHSHTKLLVWGLVVLIAADVVLAMGSHWAVTLCGVALWGLHMGMTQGLLATMVTGTAPVDLRGTAFGIFNLASGLALLVASALAGWLWDSFGAAFTFYGGAVFCSATITLVWSMRAYARQHYE